MTETAGSGDAVTEAPTVLVTGGSRGLGLELCRGYAARGARVALCGRDEVALERARAELAATGAPVLAVACDIADPGAVARLVATVTDRFGAIDVLVNNAAVMTVGPAELQGIAEIERLMGVAFWGAVHASFAVLPAMRARRKGTIVNITSIGGRLSAPHLVAYSAAKAALLSFSEGLAAEERRQGVHVLTVIPGFIRTGSEGRARVVGDEARERRWFELGGRVPLLAITPERAARRIIDAATSGRRALLLTPLAQVVGRTAALSPSLTALVLDGVNRLLPQPPPAATAASEAGGNAGSAP